MTTSGRANAAIKTIGFGHAPEHERHHFVVAIPRAQMAEVAPGPSRLVIVHPGWKHWRPPPPAAVH